MSILTTRQRNSLKSSQFADPKNRAYPIPDAVHARNALSRAAQNGTPELKGKVRAAVHKKYPFIRMEQ
jgi:hypothetical protein